MPNTRKRRKKRPDPSQQIWHARLRLRQSHWNSLQEIAYKARRAHTHHRPTLSGLVMAILDATLPVLTKQDFNRLAIKTNGMKLSQARITTRQWVRDLLVEQLRERQP